VGKPEGKRTMENPRLKERIISRRIFWKWNEEH
jgi:hypothetical protein